MKKDRFLRSHWSRTELSQMNESYQNYWNYLDSIKHLLPANAYEFATAEWHYDPTDPKCPHDSWLESFEIKEKSQTENLSKREVYIEILMLGAYHDGKIRLSYENVRNYALSFNKTEGFPQKHGDWLIDELSLPEENHIIHYIDFSGGAHWEIHCEDILYEWIPF